MDDGNAETGSTAALRKLHYLDFCLLAADKGGSVAEEGAPLILSQLTSHSSVWVFNFT